MDKIVVTIARQYGSGGKTIGKKLADNLGIRAYSREILRMASEDSGINEMMFNQVDERLGASPLFRIIRKYKGEQGVIPPESDDFLSNHNLFNYQAKIIRDLAEYGPCVIIGRCGDFVLRDFPKVVRTFIYASAEYNRRQVIERGAYSGKDVDRFIQKTDRRRSEYYHYYTGQEWTDARNYDLCLNSEFLGDEGCVEAIKAYIRIRFGAHALDD